MKDSAGVRNDMRDEGKPSLTVVIPNYNNEKYLPICLRSCLDQTYKNLTILIVDDHSSDDSVKLIKEFQSTNSNIRLIRNEKNLMVSRTRDIGVMEAKSDWITTLDSDDFFSDPNKIEREMSLLMEMGWDPLKIAFSNITNVDESGQLLPTNRKPINEGEIWEGLMTRSVFIPRDFIFSKVLYVEVGGFDQEIPMYEDWDLKIRMSKRATYHYTGAVGVAYRQHGAGLSSGDSRNHERWMNHVFAKNNGRKYPALKRKFLINTSIRPIYRLIRKLKSILNQ